MDFDRAEIIANGTAKDGVEREVRELERLLRRRVGAEVQLRG